jgi:hypothetical protein
VPVAVASVASTIVFLATGIPLLAAFGLPGLAAGIAAQAFVYLLFRAWYLTKLFEGFRFVRHAVRAMLPTLPAIAIVLLVRALETGPRTLAEAIVEACVYALAVIAATWAVEGNLLREVGGYLVARASGVATAPGDPTPS